VFVGWRAFNSWKDTQTINIIGHADLNSTRTADWNWYWSEGCNAVINYQVK